MTDSAEKERHVDQSHKESIREADTSTSNVNDGKLVNDIAEKYRPTVAELASAQLDRIHTELSNPPAKYICTPETPTGAPYKDAPRLQSWDGIVREPPKSIEEVQMEYERILAAPLARAGELVIGAKFKEAFGTGILIYKFFDGLNDKTEPSPTNSNYRRQQK